MLHPKIQGALTSFFWILYADATNARPFLLLYNMEPEVLKFLQRISWSIFLGFTWMAINSTVGIMLKWGYYEEVPVTGNYIFWAWLILSSAGLTYYMYKLWKRPLGLPRYDQHSGWH